MVVILIPKIQKLQAMWKFLIVGMWVLIACSSNDNHQVIVTVTNNDTSIIKTSAIEGIWEIYNRPYESSFILIDKDSIFFLKGPSQKYFFRHDTLNLEGGGFFKRKVIEVAEEQMKLVNLSGDTLILKRKI